MFMAAMRLAGVGEVVYAYSNDDGAPYGLSTAAIYADLAKSFSEQSTKISYVPGRLGSRHDLHWKIKRRQDHQTWTEYGSHRGGGAKI